MTDVPLPEPSGVIFYEGDQYEEGWESSVPAYDEAQLLAYAEACVKAERERAQAEVLAWRTRFPQYTYRPQDDCVSLRLDQAMDGK